MEKKQKIKFLPGDAIFFCANLYTKSIEFKHSEDKGHRKESNALRKLSESTASEISLMLP